MGDVTFKALLGVLGDFSGEKNCALPRCKVFPGLFMGVTATPPRKVRRLGDNAKVASLEGDKGLEAEGAMDMVLTQVFWDLGASEQNRYKQLNIYQGQTWMEETPANNLSNLPLDQFKSHAR
jgi:hypothetical protein